MTHLLRNNDFFRLVILANITLLLAGIYNLRISPGGLDMIDPPTLIALFISASGVFLSLLVAIIAAVWAVARINALHTERWARIEAVLESIASTIDRLQSWLAQVDKKQDRHGEDIAKLKVKSNLNGK